MVKAETLKTAINIIKTTYVDEKLANVVARDLTAYIQSAVGQSRMSLENQSSFIWDLNSTISSLTRDLHFGFTRSQLTAVNTVPALRYSPHYLRILRMDDINNEITRKQLHAAFSQLKEPVALDLRDCAGGDADATYYILCHFFKDDTPLFEIESRLSSKKMFIAASAHPAFATFNRVVKFTGKLSVIVNSQTFSGGEILAKTLQSHGRAKVFGARTGGAFNVTKQIRIDDIFLNIPFARILDAVTHEDSDKIGVIPDYDPSTREYISLIFTDVSDSLFASY